MRQGAKRLCAAAAVFAAACTADRMTSPTLPSGALPTTMIAAARAGFVLQAQNVREALAGVTTLPRGVTSEQEQQLAREAATLRGMLDQLNGAIDSLDRGVGPSVLLHRQSSSPLARAMDFAPAETASSWGPGTLTAIRLNNLANSSVDFNTQVNSPVEELDAYLSGTISIPNTATTQFSDEASKNILELPVVFSLPGNHPLDVSCQTAQVTVTALTHHVASGSVEINGVDTPLSYGTTTQDGPKSCLPWHVTVTLSPSQVTAGGTCSGHRFDFQLKRWNGQFLVRLAVE